MNEEQKKSAQQALADHYHEACRIEDTEPIQLLYHYRLYWSNTLAAGIQNAFWVHVNRPGQINRTVIMLEIDGSWHIAEIPWT